VKSPPIVLCVDDDRDIGEIVQAVLTDEGYAVSLLYNLEDDALMRTVGRLEPDCVLLDSNSSVGYGEAWASAASLALRQRAVPVIMFTAHWREAQEAREDVSNRAVAAHFEAVLDKPFNIDDLLFAVAQATEHSVPFDRTEAGESERTRSLVAALEQRGATDIIPSRMREWATFRNVQGRLCQIYWWQSYGVYQVGRYQPDSGRMKMIGYFVTRDAAIEAALPA
jgi:CheY-like chemotaxis protein